MIAVGERTIVDRYRDEELELGEVVNFQIPVELDAGRRWLEAGQTLVSVTVCGLSYVVECQSVYMRVDQPGPYKGQQ